jgi:hypothetical protein
MTDHITELPAGLDRAILRILSYHEGADKAISRVMLRGDCLRHGFHVNDRTLRAAINHLRKQGHLICSAGGEGGGYYQPASQEEFEDYIHHELYPRVFDMLEQVKAMKVTAKKTWGTYLPDNQLPLL